MASHATHTRRIYSPPWRDGSLANPDKIPTCIQVSVRPETTGTLETMSAACTQLPAVRTALAGVGRIHVHDRDSGGTSLVVDKTLQLPECPTVQPGAHAPATPQSIADVRQVLHHDRGSPDATGLLDDGLARFVVDLFDTPPLFAGDLPESLPCTLAAVGLQTTTQGQMLITPMAQRFPAPDPARAGGGECIFPHVHPHDRAGHHRFNVERLNDEIEEPLAVATQQFRFLRATRCKDLPLLIPENHRHPHASLQRVERNRLVLERISTVVEMDAGAVEPQERNRGIWGDASRGLLRAIRLADREDGVARHLRAQRGLLPQAPVAEPVQGHPVPTAFCLHKRHQSAAGLSISGPQCAQLGSLLRSHIQANRGGAQHLAPLGHLLGALDRALYRAL